MPAYTLPIVRPKCPDCHEARLATVEVRNTRNEHIGFFCGRHGAVHVTALNREHPPIGAPTSR